VAQQEGKCERTERKTKQKKMTNLVLGEADSEVAAKFSK